MAARAEEERDGELVLTRAFQMGTTKAFRQEAVGTVCPVRVALRHTSNMATMFIIIYIFDNKNYKERNWRDGLAVNSRI